MSINGYNCRVWYKNQPAICNPCAVQGHKSADCPNKDKCRRYGASGHFARNCKGVRSDDDENLPQASGVDPPPLPSSADLAAVADEALASHSREAGIADPLPFASKDELPLGETGTQDLAADQSLISWSSVSDPLASQEAGVSNVVTSEVGVPPPSGAPSSDATIDESNSSSLVVSTDRVAAADCVVVDSQTSVAHGENVESSGGCPSQVSPPLPSSPNEEYLFTCGQQVPSQESSLSSPASRALVFYINPLRRILWMLIVVSRSITGRLLICLLICRLSMALVYLKEKLKVAFP